MYKMSQTTFQTDRPISLAMQNNNLKSSAFSPWQLLYRRKPRRRSWCICSVYICLSGSWNDLVWLIISSQTRASHYFMFCVLIGSQTKQRMINWPSVLSMQSPTEAAQISNSFTFNKPGTRFTNYLTIYHKIIYTLVTYNVVRFLSWIS